MLQQVFSKGPFTQGIFRKSANARIVRETREQLDSGASPTVIEHLPVLATAVLLKEFFRSLPEPLLAAALYKDWLEAVDGTPDEPVDDKLVKIKRFVQSYFFK
jgi:Rho GTPase-activating protein 20